jgi:hypothetical protein
MLGWKGSERIHEREDNSFVNESDGRKSPKKIRAVEAKKIRTAAKCRCLD